MNDSDEIVVTEGKPLNGTIKIQGSKNAALPIMAAALMKKGPACCGAVQNRGCISYGKNPPGSGSCELVAGS